MKALLKVWLILLITGCANSGSSKNNDMVGMKFLGGTMTEGPLKEKILATAVPYAKIGSGCDKSVEFLHTELLPYAEEPNFNNKNELTSGKFVERWTFSFCDKQKIVYITIWPLPGSQSRFRVSTSP
jgi:hypothetical protein